MRRLEKRNEAAVASQGGEDGRLQSLGREVGYRVNREKLKVQRSAK